MMLNAFRYFDLTSLLDFERMTIREYSIRMTAIALKKLDQEELIHQQAWANWQVQATKTRGKAEVPIYRNFKQFFDKEKIESEILGIKKAEPDKRLMQLLKKANK
ncbi:hypothetical protein [Lactococcus taiwanensis]|uniref:hypothetical protein n=1 Tax=Lactococcus taiwanensis TaxID=1151742 RepID=UPI002896B5CB|nr:hypothetical protein [Lactococcus taiwanensis]